MATVFVWQNHYFGGDHSWTGHASMNITDDYTDTRPLEAQENGNAPIPNSSDVPAAAGSIHHVSFWPGSGGGGFTDKFKPGVKYMAMAKPSLFADAALEGYAPDHVIRLEGLNILKMGSEWNSIRNKQNAHYRFVRKNCSTIVARVLRAAVPWHSAPHHLVWTPCDVRDFAFKFGKAIKWSDFISELERGMFGSKEQLAFLRTLKRRSLARGTSGGEAWYA